jgi:hypothetical protein
VEILQARAIPDSLSQVILAFLTRTKLRVLSTSPWNPSLPIPALGSHVDQTIPPTTTRSTFLPMPLRLPRSVIFPLLQALRTCSTMRRTLCM